MPVTQDYAAAGWLQAFIGANDPLLQRARLETKKYIDSVDVLCSLTTIREKRDQVENALQDLWDFANKNELGWLLKNVPVCQSQWVLPSNDDFTIECNKPPKIESAKELGCALGIDDWSTNVRMRIRSSEFTTWQRRVARIGSGAPIGFTMASSNAEIMDLDCTASWTANDWADGIWTFQIADQPYMNAKVEEPIQTQRPIISDHLESILLSLVWADNELRSAKNPKLSYITSIPPWIPVGDRLLPIHESVHGGRNELRVTQVFADVWDSVWPLAYCRRRKLGRGHCELKLIRDRVDQSLSTEPRLFCWLAFLAEMLIQTYTTDGLGISAKYSRD